jgi:hypothetical protein
MVGCATQTFYVNDSHHYSSIVVDESQPFFVYGIGQNQSLDANKVCGDVNKIHKIETEYSFLDVMLGFVTYNIYSPRTAKIYCYN